MSRKTAEAIWGADVVASALSEANPAPITAALAREVEARADPPGAFRAWGLAQPWPRFCAIVRIVAGRARADITRSNQ